MNGYSTHSTMLNSAASLAQHPGVVGDGEVGGHHVQQAAPHGVG